MIELIIFDFDGTLVDSKDISVGIFNKLAEKYHVNKIDDHSQNIWTAPLLEKFKILNFPIHKFPLFAIDFTKHYQESLKSINLVHGIKELLLELRKLEYKLAIVSANSESNIRDFLKENNLDVFETISSSRSFLGKERVIKKLLDTHEISSSEAIYIGDEIRDIRTCKKLGIKIVWVGWGFDSTEMIDRHSPDYVVNSPKEILSILS